MGTVLDRSGKPGIDQTKADAFFAECAAFDGWIKKADADATTILPAGEATSAASAAVNAVKAKVDDYFGRCRLVAFDPRTATLLNRKEEEYAAIAVKELSINADEIKDFPLAQVAAGKPLPLQGAVNPAHATAIATLNSNAVKPLLGDTQELTEADWALLPIQTGRVRNLARRQDRSHRRKTWHRAHSRNPGRQRQGKHQCSDRER